MKNYFDKFISYESKHILIIIGSILLILANLIHLVYKEYIIIFQILFIISYITLIIGIIVEQKKINIVTLINKVIIIGLVSLGIYYDYNKLNNNKI
jgi:hypothetical protein